MTRALLADPRERARFLALSDERDRAHRRELAAWRAGYAAAWQAGYDQGSADEHAAWMGYHAPAHAAARERARHPGYLRLEILRYAPAGWHGTIPPGLDAAARRRWLAARKHRADRPAGTAR